MAEKVRWWSEHEYDDTVSLHVDDDIELAGNLNNILGTNKESDDEDYDWSEKFNSKTWKRWRNMEKSIKLLQILQIKFDKTLMRLKNSKAKWKHIKTAALFWLTFEKIQ